LNDETGRLLLDVGCLLDFSPSGIVRLVQSLGLCFYPHLKCLKRFIVLLPQKLQYHCRGSDRGDFMRAYIMIVALPVFGMFALVYTARTHDRTYAGFNCTVE
jgi:hypothetical protein